MVTVGAFEAKTHLSALLERVANGERFTITRHGVPVAMLVPPKAGASIRDAKALMEELRRFRESHPLDGLTIREMIDEGRRF